MKLQSSKFNTSCKSAKKQKSDPKREQKDKSPPTTLHVKQQFYAVLFSVAVAQDGFQNLLAQRHRSLISLLPPCFFFFKPSHHLLSFIHARCFPSLLLFVASFEVAGSPVDFRRGQKRAALLSERACRRLHSRGHLSLVALRQRWPCDCTRTSSSQPPPTPPIPTLSPVHRRPLARTLECDKANAQTCGVPKLVCVGGGGGGVRST